MSIFKKKKSGDYSVLTDNYVPASLPTCGLGLENFVTADYPMNKSEIVEARGCSHCSTENCHY